MKLIISYIKIKSAYKKIYQYFEEFYICNNYNNSTFWLFSTLVL